MPGRRWTKQEKKSLRFQAKNVTSLADIHIANRTRAGINYKLHALGLRILRWTRKEVSFLRRMVKCGHQPWDLYISGRSKVAIRHKAIRIKAWKPRKRQIRPWTMAEIKRLKHLVQDCSYTARLLTTNGYFPYRTIDSIAQQMRRQKIKRL